MKQWEKQWARITIGHNVHTVDGEEEGQGRQGRQDGSYDFTGGILGDPLDGRRTGDTKEAI